MKRTAALVLLACAVVLVLAPAGCGKKAAETPGETAAAFLDALIAQDNGEAYSLLSEKFKGEWGVTPMTWNGVMTRNPIPENATYSIVSENVQGDTAVVNITTPGGQDRVQLVKENGKWLLDYELNEWYGLAPSGYPGQ